MARNERVRSVKDDLLQASSDRALGKVSHQHILIVPSILTRIVQIVIGKGQAKHRCQAVDGRHIGLGHRDLAIDRIIPQLERIATRIGGQQNAPALLHKPFHGLDLWHGEWLVRRNHHHRSRCAQRIRKRVVRHQRDGRHATCRETRKQNVQLGVIHHVVVCPVDEHLPLAHAHICVDKDPSLGPGYLHRRQVRARNLDRTVGTPVIGARSHDGWQHKQRRKEEHATTGQQQRAHPIAHPHHLLFCGSR